MPTFKLENHVHMTTDTTGTSNPYVLDASSGFRTFDNYMDDQDLTWYTCYDQEDPVNYESGVGRYNSTTGTLTRVDVIQSTNTGSLVNWPSPGTRDIVCGVPSNVFARPTASGPWGIINPNAPRGFPTKTSDPATALIPQWEFRSIDSSDVNNITVDNSTGQAGNVYINTARDLPDLLQKNGTAGPLTTMDSELILDSTVTRITGLDSSEHIFRYGVGDEFFMLRRLSARDVELLIYEGGSGTPVKAVTEPNHPNLAQPIYCDVSTSTTETYGGALAMQVSVDIPAGISDMTILVDACIQFRATSNSPVVRACNMEMSATGGSGWVVVASAGAGTFDSPGGHPTSGNGAVYTSSMVYAHLDATANSTFEFRVYGSAGPHMVCGMNGSNIPHIIRLLAYRQLAAWP
jgi:hypothetical protein